jgi:predicted DsbA family dithiol-disulfide isomerase
MSDSAAMTVEVWSDIVCPWCRMGKAHLDRALEAFEHADDVSVVWRSFELDPNSPRTRDETLDEHLAAKLGRSMAEVEQMQAHVRQRGETVGIDFRFDLAHPANSFDGHRLLHLAKDRGLQDSLADALFNAYFTEGQVIGDPTVLQRIAEESGLDADDVRSVLASDAYADAVRADEQEARALQVNGVPFFVFDRRLAVSGAQPTDVLLAGLEQAWETRTAIH